MLSAELKTHKNRFRARLHPGHHWVSLHRSPDLLVGGQGVSCPRPQEPHVCLGPLGLAPPLLTTCLQLTTADGHITILSLWNMIHRYKTCSTGGTISSTSTGYQHWRTVPYLCNQTMGEINMTPSEVGVTALSCFTALTLTFDLHLQNLIRSSVAASEYSVSFIKTVQAVHEILCGNNIWPTWTDKRTGQWDSLENIKPFPTLSHGWWRIMGTVLTLYSKDLTRTYVSGTDIYPHMPTYVHTPRDFTNGASPAWRLHGRISTVMRWAWPACWLIHPILGFRGSKVPGNWRFPALDADEPQCKIWRR